MVNIDFEWFPFDPEIDAIGTQTLLRQLLDVDSVCVPLHPLTSLILSQTEIGSTVKVEDKNADPYFMLTVLNITEHVGGNEGMKGLCAWLLERVESEKLITKGKEREQLGGIEDVIRSAQEGKEQVGLILSSRLLNMPPEIVPPTYDLLLSEISDKPSFSFAKYVILSRAYREVESTLPNPEPSSKKSKKTAPTNALFYFHPEDEVFAKFGAASASFGYKKGNESSADSKRAFQEMGVRTCGFVAVVEAGKFRGAVQEVEKAFR